MELIRIVICSFYLVIVLLSYGCTDPCNNNKQVAVARQYITDATEVIEDSFEHSVRTVSLPTLPEGQTLLIAGPYQITKRWLKANTTLNSGQQSLLIDLSNGREQVSIAVISASCLIQDAYLDTRYRVAAEDSILLFGSDDANISIKKSEGEHPFAILSKP